MVLFALLFGALMVITGCLLIHPGLAIAAGGVLLLLAVVDLTDRGDRL